MKVDWVDVGQPSRGCLLPFEDGMLLITPRNIEIWRAYPDAIFTVVRTSSVRGGITYAIKQWESADAELNSRYGS